MLIKIQIENFKSFDKLTELTMMSSTKIREQANHRVTVGSDTKILKNAIIYGANAAGKSNLIDAISFIKEVLEKGLPLNCKNLFCKKSLKNETKDSLFEIQLEINGKYYAYGFSANLSGRWISSEWLYELYQNGSSKCLFTRNCAEKPLLGDEFKVTSDEYLRFNMYAEDFQDNIVDLFLTELNRKKKYTTDSTLLIFEKVYQWLMNNIVIITPRSSTTSFKYYQEENTLHLINNLIQTFDTGISQVRTEEIEMDKLTEMISAHSSNELVSKIKEKIDSIKQTKYYFNISGRTDNCFFNVEVSEDKDPVITILKLKHGKSIYDFDFEEESDGTKRLFDLMDMLLTKKDDIVFVVDELERSLHPKLTERFLKMFEMFHDNNKVQLLFTTHEAAILDQHLFRRDEIWFVERDSNCTSRIFSLDQFKERYDKKLSKAYLEGRYGAIPVFSEFTFEEEK